MWKKDIVERHQLAASESMVWGRDDCCQWVRAIILDHGGPDIMAGLPRYDSEAGAAAVMNGCLVETALAIARNLGFDKVPLPFTDRRALIGVVAGERGPALAIRYNGWWLARAQRGVLAMPDRFCVLAWRVTCLP